LSPFEAGHGHDNCELAEPMADAQKKSIVFRGLTDF